MQADSGRSNSAVTSGGRKAGRTTLSDVRRGLVERHSGYGRGIYATITDGGRAALKAAAPPYRQQVRRLILNELTPEADEQLAEIPRLTFDGLNASRLSAPGWLASGFAACRGGYGGAMADPISAVLFDVDGTLIDSNYLNTVAWWEAFAQAGHAVEMARIHRAIGMGSDQLLGELLPAGRDEAADGEIAAAHAALYSVYWSRLRPLPGAARLLRACHEHGLRVVLASSAGPRELEVLRAALDADDAIDEVTSAGDVDESKPAPDLVQVALQKAGTSPQGAVFVGDAVWDAKACGRAGVACIGLLSGGTSEAELRGAGASRVYPGPAELLEAFPASLLG